ncbi:MAG: hypothetical protein M1433_01095 [Candidatus Parvarchaeota archaeon]|nr:hypothetical protein [Candidatus Parvarchaeota archaeon]
MRPKKRYILASLSGVDSEEEFEKMLFNTITKLDPLLPIKGNFRVIKGLTRKADGGMIGVISIANKYKYDVIFLLSLVGKFYKANLLTLKSSGNINKVKKVEETRNGTDA